MEKKYVVGVDCGTTSSKTVIFDFKTENAVSFRLGAWYNESGLVSS